MNRTAPLEMKARLVILGGDLGLSGTDVTVSGSQIFAREVRFEADQHISIDSSASISATAFSLGAPEFRLASSRLLAPAIQVDASRVLIGDGATVEGNLGGSQATVRITAPEEIVIRGRSRIFFGVDATGERSALVELRAGRLVIEEGSSIVLSTRDERALRGIFDVGIETNPQPGGTVRIFANQVTLRSGGFIDSSSLNSVAGGLIDIDASESVEMSDPGSGLFAISGFRGKGGRIEVSAPRVALRDSARISTEVTVDPSFAGVNPARIRELDPPNVVFESLGKGKGGEIAIEGAVITIGPGAQVSSATAGSGDGGVIRLLASKTLLVIRGGVTVEATGSGDAGRVEIAGKESVRLEDAVIATSSTTSSGGDISVSSRFVDINNSVLSTNVGAGNGGNIEIDADVLLLRSGSQVVARAKSGPGGDIRIRARAFIRDPSAVVDASSEVGLDGTVEIRQPAIDLNASLRPLSSIYADASRLLVERCHLRDREGVSSFQVGGREDTPETTKRRTGVRYSRIPVALGPADRGAFDEFLHVASNMDVRQVPVDDVIRIAEVLESVGEFSRSRAFLASALARAEGAERGRVLGLRGRLGARSGLWTNAVQDFGDAARVAEEARDVGLVGRIALDRGLLEFERGEGEAAKMLFARALDAASDASDPDTLARARAALAQAHLGQGRVEALIGAIEELSSLTPTHDRLLATLDMAGLLAEIPGDLARIRAGEVIARVVEQARDLGDAAVESRGWSQLAELYAREKRVDEVIELGRRALAAAGRSDRSDLIYHASRLLGNALEITGDLVGATRSYERGLDALDAVRGGAALSQRAHSAFAAAFPGQEMTMDLVDVLLKRAGREPNHEVRASLLLAAQARLEAANRREIRDYFQDECLALEEVSRVDALEDALVIYPVLLEDRAELLVSGVDGIDRILVQASPEELEEALQSLRVLLEDRSTHEYRRPASQLYEWMIKPLTPLLGASKDGAERTLVFIPSGAFAGVPFGALYDEQHGQFLIEQRAVAFSPGLSLIEPRNLGTGPHAFLQAALTTPVADLPALTSARAEIEAIRDLVGGKTLLDSEFVASALDRELASAPYEVVHIASHGQFGGDTESTFLVTFDGRLGMSELADAVSRTRFRERPLELLTLSACQTAAGDERSALGLAGVALRAGARSTLASLWSVNDPATAQLMGAFYRPLLQQGASRARALQVAQQSFLADRLYRHPAYWAPFVLVGSWR